MKRFNSMIYLILRRVRLDTANSGRDNGNNVANSKTLLVAGQIPDLSDDDLKKYFSIHGTVQKVIRKFDKDGNSLRYAFVVYSDCESVEKALDDSVQSINGKLVDVRRARPQLFAKTNEKENFTI